METVYDITEVCQLLGTTSRTLRYYEEQGVIESTEVNFSKRRRYSNIQIDRIKKVMALRTLGFSVKKIKALLDKKLSLEDAILEHRAQIMQLISEKQAQINLLEEVLCDIRGEKYEKMPNTISLQCSDTQLEIAKICTDATLRDDFSTVEQHFSEEMRSVLPAPVLQATWMRMIKGIGNFVRLHDVERVPEMPNIVVHPIEYEKMILRMQYVFHGEIICGLWMNYFKTKTGGFSE